MPHNWQLTDRDFPRITALITILHTISVCVLNHGYESNLKLELRIRQSIKKKRQIFRYLSNVAAVRAFASVGPDAILGCACVT
jgi:hypothetical protein